jgi:hypothetical protein
MAYKKFCPPGFGRTGRKMRRRSGSLPLFHELHFHYGFAACLFVLFLFGSSIVGAESDASRGSNGTSSGGGGSTASHDANSSMCEYIKQYCQEHYTVSGDQVRWRECLANKLRGTDARCPDIVEKLRWLNENDPLHKRNLQLGDDVHEAASPVRGNEQLLERLRKKLSSLSKSERLCAEELQLRKKERCRTSSVPFCAEQTVLRALEDGECRMASGGGEGFNGAPSQTVVMEKGGEPQPLSVARSPAAILGEMVARVIDALERMPEGAEKERVRLSASTLGALIGRVATEGVGAVMPDIKILMGEVMPLIDRHGRGFGRQGSEPNDGAMRSAFSPQGRIRAMLERMDSMMGKIPEAFRRMRERGYVIEGWEEIYDEAKILFARSREICRNAMESDDMVAVKACLVAMREVFDGKMRELEHVASRSVPGEVMHAIGREMGFDEEPASVRHGVSPQTVGPSIPLYDSPRNLVPEGAMENFDPPEYLKRFAKECLNAGRSESECHREIMNIMMKNMFSCMADGRSEVECKRGMVEDFGGNAEEDMHYFEE